MKRPNLDDNGGRGAGVSAVFAKDTLRCWLRSWKRFVSIAVITLLGVAVLTGIYAGPLSADPVVTVEMMAEM